MQQLVDEENKEKLKEYRTIVIRRVKRRGPTILAGITVNQIETDAVLDTGSEVTIISEEFGRRNSFLQEGERVKLLNAEDGSCMYGRSGVIVDIRLGDTRLKWPVVIAPIGEDVLLGLDYLYEVDAYFTGRGIVKVNGKIVPTKMVKEHEEEVVACSVVCARVTVEIPPNTADVETFKAKQVCRSEQENPHLDGLLGSLNSLPEEKEKLTRALLIKYEDVDDVIPLAICQIQKEEVEERQEWFPENTREEVQELQRKDKDLKSLFEWFEKDDRPSKNQIMIDSPAVRNFWRHSNRVRLKNVLFYKGENDDRTTADRLIIPRESRRKYRD